MSDGADGYFFYFPNMDDMVVYSEHYIGMKSINTLQDVLKGELIKGQGGWKIKEDGGKKYALLRVDFNSLTYGAWISLDEVQEDILKGVSYAEREFSFLESDENIEHAAGDKEKVVLSADAKKLTLVLTLNKNEIIKMNTFYQRILMVIAVSYLMLIPLLYLYIKRVLIYPLRKINEAHHEIEIGNKDFRLCEAADSKEFMEANQSFNRMADNLNSLKIAVYESELERQKIQLRNLQLQIRPHFLQNTFNLIYNLAQKKSTEPIQKIMLYLSSYFRYIFRNKKELELFAKELEMIEGYVQMASFRYEGMIDFLADIDPEIVYVRTPPLLIHNFIENSVKHGFCQERVLHINLDGRYDDGWVTFTISDDGNGMSEEILRRNQQICGQELELENETEHIGLYNSVKRLKHYYGETASIEVDSEAGEMSCFTIRFPYNLEVDDESLHGE